MKKTIERTAFPGLIPLPEPKFYSREDIWDAWELAGDRQLLIATDRIWINETLVGAIPDKGRCLAGLVLFWADFFKKSAVISGDLSYACNHSVWLEAWNNDLEGRTLVVRNVPVMPLRWVVGNNPEHCRIVSVNVKTCHEPGSCKEAMAILKKWIAKNRIKDLKSGEYLKPESLKKRMESIAGCLFRKAQAHAVARGLNLSCSVLSFGWLDNAPVLVGDFFTPNSSSLSLAGEDLSPEGLINDWLAKKKWRPEDGRPKIPCQLLETAGQQYREILERVRK